MKFTLFFVLTAFLCSAKANLPQPSDSSQAPQKLAQDDWTQIHKVHHAERDAFHAVEDGYQASNTAQQWITRFDGRGFIAQPDNQHWQWGLELKSYGFTGKEHRFSSSAVSTVAGKKLTYMWDSNLHEWFVNDSRGLEHGFTVMKRPEHLPTQASQHTAETVLSFTLSVRGGLVPQILSNGQGIAFLDNHGKSRLNYAGLKVWDADGSILSAYFELSGDDLRLHVDEGEARYPLTIDPIAQQAHLNAESPTPYDKFGWSVAISGDTVVVGALEEDSSTTGVNKDPDELAAQSGAAYVFRRNESTWIQEAYLKPGNIDELDEFGHSVAIDGDIIVVGARREDSIDNAGPFDSGAAYVFERSDNTWTQTAYLKASNPGAGDNFGVSVAVDGDTIVVGAVGEDSSSRGVNSVPDESSTGAGAAYVFVREGASWVQQAYLKNNNTSFDQRLGWSVAISGDTIAAGAYAEQSDTSGINSTPNTRSSETGAVYVFVRNGATWTQEAYIKANPSGAGDRFGWAVGISGDTIVSSAYSEDSDTTGVNSTPNDDAPVAGAAYVFTREGTTWTQQAYLKASNTQADDVFGWSAAISGDTVVVGAYHEDSDSTGVNSIPNDERSGAGAAYTFVRNGSSWTQRDYLKGSNLGVFDEFGFSVAVSEPTIVVGAQFAFDWEGAAYVFSDLPSLQAWRQNNFGTTANAGKTANDSDFEDDGWANLLEYGLVTDPTIPTAYDDSVILIDSANYLGSGYLQTVFLRDPTRNDVTIRVEVSGHPGGPWTTAASSVLGATFTGEGFASETDLAHGLKQVVVRDTVSYDTPNQTRRFLRLRVEE